LQQIHCHCIPLPAGSALRAYLAVSSCISLSAVSHRITYYYRSHRHRLENGIWIRPKNTLPLQGPGAGEGGSQYTDSESQIETETETEFESAVSSLYNNYEIKIICNLQKKNTQSDARCRCLWGRNNVRFFIQAIEQLFVSLSQPRLHTRRSRSARGAYSYATTSCVILTRSLARTRTSYLLTTYVLVGYCTRGQALFHNHRVCSIFIHALYYIFYFI